MENQEEYLIDTDGETSALLAPQKSDLAYIAPNELPNLEDAEVGFSLEAKYLKFDEGMKRVRAVFNGFTEIHKRENGELQPMKAAVLQNKDGLFLNSTSNILDQLSRIPVGTAVQIEYVGTEKTSNGYQVKKFDIRVLNVSAKVQVVKIEQKQTAGFKNSQRATEYYTLAYSDKFKFTEDEAKAHLIANGGDFSQAIEGLSESQAEF